MLRQSLLLLHLLGAIAWLGGMFFAYFCLRPAAAETLDPPRRLPLWAAVFGRFLPMMAVAVAVQLATGFGLLLPVGFAAAPLGWHLMMGLGLAMALVFVLVWARHFPRLRAHCAAAQWPQAGAALNEIRRLVALNLVLGGVVIAAAAYSS